MDGCIFRLRYAHPLNKIGEWTHVLAKGRQFLFLMSSTIFLMVKSGKSIVCDRGGKKSTTKEKDLLPSENE